MPSVNETLLDRIVLQQVRLLRLSTGLTRRVLAALRVLDRQLASLAEAFYTGNAGTLAATRLRGAVAQAYGQAEEAISRELHELGLFEADFTYRVLYSGLPTELQVSLSRPGASQIVAAVAQPIQGRTLREWFGGLVESTYVRLRDSVRLGVVEGLTTGKIVSRARQALEVDRRGAEAVVRTLTNGVAIAARQTTMQANAELFSGVQWVSTLDARTTPICQQRDGEVYPLDKGPRPPAHVNCRSTVVPVVKGADELGLPPATRASMDGQVAEDVVYGDWLRRQSPAVQDEVLGKTRARLFREGKLALDKFIDSSGTYYTLEELRKREAKEWRRVFGA